MDSWEVNRNGASAKDQTALLDGTPDEKVQTWLKVTADASGRPKSGAWMTSLVPFIKLLSTNPTGPHPSCTFGFTVQDAHCNRMDSLHGGCAATLYDYCTTLPLALVNRKGFWEHMGVSRTLAVTYMRPAPPGVEILIECEIVQVGKKLATLRGTMRRKSDGALLSTCEHGKVNVDADVKL